jgi:phosphoribosylformylglycinamidine synthase
MASEEFKEGSEQKRPNVQMGDPFMEKLLLEACLEAMKTGAVLGIQDMGAAGLTCSTCEMGARGGVGVEIELDYIPQRETGMSAYEIMLSESQERMLLVAQKGREDEVLRVFSKWGLDAVIAGEVIAQPRLRVKHHGELVADIPNESLTDEAPVYHRPVGTWTRPEQIKIPLDPPADVLAELNKARDYSADLKTLLASSNICSKRWVFEQYDSMVQTNTVQGPGSEAGVMRIKGSGTPGHERGLAMALAGNGRWCYLDPKLGAMHAVAEAARKVACTGATPRAATNCLNFGNPEKPEIMAQFSATIDGLAEACNALGTPITGGNVSLYNETKGEGIYPTPVVGVVGILDDVSKAVPAGFQKAGDSIFLLVPPLARLEGKEITRNEQASELGGEWQVRTSRSFGSSAAAQALLGFWGCPPELNLEGQRKLNECLRELASENILNSAVDVSDGGLAVALAKSSLHVGVGAKVDVGGVSTFIDLFAEDQPSVLISCDPKIVKPLKEIAEKFGVWANYLGATTTNAHLDILVSTQPAVELSISDLQTAWSNTLPTLLNEVHA